MQTTNEYCNKILVDKGFYLSENNDKYCKMGELWELSNKIGKGDFWIYEQENLYSIKIQDFSFNEDTIIDVDVPKCLCVTLFESISGEGLVPYKHLEANCIKSFIGPQKYKAMIHKKIPVRSISLEIYPEYYNSYLKKVFPVEYENLHNFFKNIDGVDEYSNFLLPFSQIQKYRGQGIAAKLFFEAKVSEIVSLIVEYKKPEENKSINKLSESDIYMLMNVTSYINDHYAFNIKLYQLAKIACMGTTKLKYTFKLLHNCTITEYIQKRRISQAEHLFSNTNLTISQVAQTVGYSSSSRFSELFKKFTGILPNEYRKLIKN